MAGRSFNGVGNPVLIATATTTQITTKSTVLERIIIQDGTVTIYDDASANNNKILDVISVSHECGILLKNGLRVVTVGAPTNVTIIYSEV